MSEPNWDDLNTPELWADTLEQHAETVARRLGAYDMHSDLNYAAACIRDLANKVAMCAQKAEQLQDIVIETQRKAKAALESLTRVPT